MSKRNQVQFSRPEDPKFLKLIKEQIGYKNEPSVDTKRQKLNQEFDDSSDSDDEQPQIVIVKSGDLSAEQVEAEKRRIESENLKKPADLSQRVIFKAKSTKAEKSSGTEEKNSGAGKKDKSKRSVTTSKLSFDLEDENYDSGE
ncbi:hypothetical protein HA402_009890 [Bradysia odoriphaga]|nr:hypothetical protein HA402_009890 [Bradysia odoriphaga]